MKTNLTDRKIKIRTVEPRHVVRMNGKEIPVQKIVQGDGIVMKEISVDGVKKITEEEFLTKDKLKVQEEIYKNTIRTLEDRFGKLKKFSWNEIKLENGKKIPYSLYAEALNETTKGYPLNQKNGDIYWHAYRNETGEICYALKYEPHTEPPYGNLRNQYRKDVFKLYQRYLDDYLVNTIFEYDEKYRIMREIKDLIQPKYECLKDVLDEFSEISEQNQKKIQNQLKLFIVNLMAMFRETGHFPNLDEDMISIDLADKIIFDEDYNLKITSSKHPYVIPWVIQAEYRAKKVPYTDVRPFRMSDDIKERIYKDANFKHDILASRLRKVDCLDLMFKSIEELWITFLV